MPCIFLLKIIFCTFLYASTIIQFGMVEKLRRIYPSPDLGFIFFLKIIHDPECQRAQSYAELKSWMCHVSLAFFLIELFPFGPVDLRIPSWCNPGTRINQSPTPVVTFLFLFLFFFVLSLARSLSQFFCKDFNLRGPSVASRSAWRKMERQMGCPGAKRARHGARFSLPTENGAPRTLGCRSGGGVGHEIRLPDRGAVCFGEQEAAACFSRHHSSFLGKIRRFLPRKSWRVAMGGRTLRFSTSTALQNSQQR